MLEIPVIRWGQPYESKDQAEVVHFETGETLAKVHQSNAGLLKLDMKKARKARAALLEHSIDDLVELSAKAADFYEHETVPMGNGTQSPDEFCHLQSASTGLPEAMCRANMKKIAFVLRNMGEIIDALTRGLPHNVLTRGYGKDQVREVPLSYQPYSPVLGMVLPNNSPGVHTLWCPVIPMQIGVVLKPGSAEPWTPYRVYESMKKAGIPTEAFGLYPGPRDVGGAVTEVCGRSMIFGSEKTVQQYAGNPSVQVHGSGFSKILIGDDCIDQWEDYLDVMVESILINGGRSCINCSSIYASRHTEQIADALAERLAGIKSTAMNDENAQLAAFTTPEVAEAVSNDIDAKLPGATDVTDAKRNGESRLEMSDTHAFLRPTIIHCPSPDHDLANTEYMFPFSSVVECPQRKMIRSIGYTLVGTAITKDDEFARELIEATNIDRLNLGPIKTVSLNWLQPHEGNIVEFLFRNRAFQSATPELATV